MSSENFAKLYKNTSKHDDNRRRRTETSVELRKQRGNDEMMKRRNLNVDFNDESYTSGSDTEETNKAPVQLLTLEEAVKVLQNNPNETQIRNAFESVRRILSRSKDPPIDMVIQLGFPLALVQAMELNDEKVQFEATWAITNIVSGTSQQTWAIINAGALRPLLKICASPSNKLAEQAVWAIANIAGDGVKLRDMLIAEGCIPLFVNLAKRSKELNQSFVGTLTWALSNLCRHKKPQTTYEVLAQLAPALAILLKYNNVQIQSDACWAFSYLTDGTDDNIQLAYEQNIIPDIVAFISSGHDQLVSPALRVLGNFATGNDQLTQVVVDSGVLKNAIPQLLTSNNMSLVKECCWLISNLCAGNNQQIQDVIDAQLLPLILTMLEKGDHRVQYEAGWAIANLAHGGTANQVLEICRVKNGIKAICSNLTVKNNELVSNMLDALYQLLYTISTHDPENLQKACDRVEECDGLDKLEQLQQHESEKIYQNAYKIIDEFFHDEDEEDTGIELNEANQVELAGKTSVTFNF